MKLKHQSLLKALGITNTAVSQAFCAYMSLINERGCTKDMAFESLRKSYRPRVIAYFAIIGLEALSVDINRKIIRDLERGISGN